LIVSGMTDTNASDTLIANQFREKAVAAFAGGILQIARVVPRPGSHIFVSYDEVNFVLACQC
jgi:hypothetical protein